MQLQKLSLTNFRAFKQAEFEFKPGMNLIVGINGVGKSSALDAIRILFSQVLPKFSRWKNKKIKIDDENVSFGYDRFNRFNFFYDWRPSICLHNGSAA